MSQTFFSRLDQFEKGTRLGQMAGTLGKVVVWTKGSRDKFTFTSFKYDNERQELVLDSKEDSFPNDTEVLVTFELRGMTFFSQVTFKKSAGDYNVLLFKNELFKSERRSSYRLMTYPQYEVWAKFKLENVKATDDQKTKTLRTKLFQSFLKLVDDKDGSVEGDLLKLRVQDISTTGMAIHIGDMHVEFFVKDAIFKDVTITFPDEAVVVPEVKIMYAVNYISNDKNLRKYKIGLHFPNLSPKLDELFGKKITKILRDVDSNKDFENFLK